MMMFMPLMFTFMFLWAPSGLVLYWMVSNVWAIGQQVVTNRMIGPPRAVRPPADGSEPRGNGAGEGAKHGTARRQVRFVEQTSAMGLDLEVEVDDTPAARVDVRARRRGAAAPPGEALDALQHIVNTAFRRELDDDRRLVVDCMDYRKGKDAELRQMARSRWRRRRTPGGQQEIGPLNPTRAASCT